MDSMKALALLLALPLAAVRGADYFGLSASFVPAKGPGSTAMVTVTFQPRDPEVRINEEPAPRLKLDPQQTVLVDKQAPPKRMAPIDLTKVKYLDSAVPMAFPVALDARAPRGSQPVGAAVIYFYCSKREGWCRKGSSEITIPVVVP